MNIKYTLSFLLAVALLAVSCKKNFEEINTNPNAPNEVQPGLLLRQVIYDYGEEMAYEGFVAGNLLGQHFTMVDFNLFDRHSLSDPQLGGNPWPMIYTNLRDNELLLKQSRSAATFAVYEGPALILKAYMAAALTDIYGDVPYSEALQGTAGNTAPAYDSQEDIYRGAAGILENLDAGIAALEKYSGAQGLEGDILFDGDLDAWISFAHSLKIKSLMRISGQENVGSELQSIFDQGDYMQFAAQNAVFDFTNERPNSFRMQQLRDGDFNLFVLSETMEEIMDHYNDDRIEVLFRPVGNDTATVPFRGLLNGPDASQTSISVSEYSLTGTIFRENTGDLDANFMTAWETYFLLAEAAERGLISADAQTLYNQAVTLAFAYWQTPLPDDFLVAGTTSWTGPDANPDKLELILTQKWIANSINGYENWIEYRRTGYPALKTISASLNGDLIPVRMPYPTDEAALNAANFNRATGGNGNAINTPVWWDVN